MKEKRLLWFTLISIIVTFSALAIARAATWNFAGFAWIGNNLQNAAEQGDPVVGMISMKGENYKVSIQGGGDQRPLVGSAWIGIGTKDDKFDTFTSQGDSPSLGWIHFNQSFDQNKLDDLIKDNCFDAGDCYGVRWNKKSGSNNNTEGYLSGWARMEIGPNGDKTPYPETWVHFKSPGNPNNYSCNENGQNYYVCVDAQGKLEGYAWSAGADATSIEGNPGLGWINFSKKYVGLENTGDEGVVPASSKFCTALIDENGKNNTCNSNGGFTGNFSFKAYQSGITLNPLDPDKNFQWICKNGEAPKTGEKVVCNYRDTGTYTPELKIFDETAQQWISCASQASVKVTDKAECSVSVRKSGPADNGDYENNLNVSQEDKIEAKINRQCLDGGIVEWSVTGGSKTTENGDIATFKPMDGSLVKVSAEIIKNGKAVKCDPAGVSVKQSVRWR